MTRFVSGLACSNAIFTRLALSSSDSAVPCSINALPAFMQYALHISMLYLQSSMRGVPNSSIVLSAVNLVLVCILKQKWKCGSTSTLGYLALNPIPLGSFSYPQLSRGPMQKNEHFRLQNCYICSFISSNLLCPGVHLHIQLALGASLTGAAGAYIMSAG